VTFIGTLISFAVSLLFGIIGTVAISAARHVQPNMTQAYRMIAVPTAAVAGIIIFVLALAMEIRHYHQMKTLAAIERMS
jgi:cell division protein FtsX